MKILKYALNKGLDDGDIVVYKQPIVRLNPSNKSDIIRHYEILTVLKGELLDRYELNNIEVLIEELEHYNSTRFLDIAVTKRVLAWLSEYNNQQSSSEHNESILFHINIHPDSINNDSDLLLEKINKALADGNISHDSLCFEITENTLLKNPEKVGKMLEELRKRGCKIALDDFGKKMLNLTTLRVLRPDFVKIDGDYVKRSLHNEFDRVVIKSLVELSRLVGAETIAEKVETIEIYYLMRALGVDYGQGWFLGKGFLLEEAVDFDIFKKNIIPEKISME
jgi:EAL domain-containing protein (putative c-di-GMP-specific phosphodiesterase class I)